MHILIFFTKYSYSSQIPFSLLLKFWTGIRQKIRCGMLYIVWCGFIGPTTYTTDISLGEKVGGDKLFRTADALKKLSEQY